MGLNVERKRTGFRHFFQQSITPNIFQTPFNPFSYWNCHINLSTVKMALRSLVGWRVFKEPWGETRDWNVTLESWLTVWLKNMMVRNKGYSELQHLMSQFQSYSQVSFIFHLTEINLKALNILEDFHSIKYVVILFRFFSTICHTKTIGRCWCVTGVILRMVHE